MLHNGMRGSHVLATLQDASNEAERSARCGGEPSRRMVDRDPRRRCRHVRRDQAGSRLLACTPRRRRIAHAAGAESRSTSARSIARTRRRVGRPVAARQLEAAVPSWSVERRRSSSSVVLLLLSDPTASSCALDRRRGSARSKRSDGQAAQTVEERATADRSGSVSAIMFRIELEASRGWRLVGSVVRRGMQ